MVQIHRRVTANAICVHLVQEPFLTVPEGGSLVSQDWILL